MPVPIWVTTAIESKHMTAQIQLQHPKNTALVLLRRPHGLLVQASISAPEARLIYISLESGSCNKYTFFLSLRPQKFLALPKPRAAFCLIYIGLSRRS